MHSSEKEFFDSLLLFSQELDKEKRADIERKIWERYGLEVSPLIVDMSGFTRLTMKHGVVHYLSMVRRMQLTAKPIIESYGGTIVKFEADNAFAYFREPSHAVRASISLNLAMNAANLLTPEELDIHIACGIDHGECLLPQPHDFFGNPVN